MVPALRPHQVHTAGVDVDPDSDEVLPDPWHFPESADDMSARLIQALWQRARQEVALDEMVRDAQKLGLYE